MAASAPRWRDAKAQITPGIQVELVIGGMTCAACAARVQAKLNKLTGVTASVNLSTERAYVSAPPSQTPNRPGKPPTRPCPPSSSSGTASACVGSS